MHSLHGYTLGPKDRYSAKRNLRAVNFRCDAPGAQAVAIIGDFNEWNPAANPMLRQPDGTWQAQVPLCHGHQHYLFLVDGKRTLDPKAQGIGRNAQNERVSLVAVS